MIRIPSLKFTPELANVGVGKNFRDTMGTTCGLDISVLFVSIGDSTVSVSAVLSIKWSLMTVILGLVLMKGTT